jgi:hydrogenase maturation factor
MSCADDGHCVTCSDEGVAMRVRDVRDDAVAVCDGDVEVMVDLVAPVQPGDRLLVHAGAALMRLDA